MKYTLFILLFTLGFSQLTLAQSDSSSNYTLGLNVDQKARIGYNEKDGFNFPISLLLTISNQKNQFEIGPQYYLRYTELTGRGYGLLVNYKYYPNGNTNRFNGYFLTTLKFMYGSETRLVWSNTYSGKTVNGHLVTKAIAGGVRLGYGTELKISPKIYISTNVTGVINIGSKQARETFVSYPYLDTYVPYGFVSFGVKVGINIGFRF